jgi:serine/threonine protein kinase
MADTSLIRTTASFDHTLTRPGIAQESVKGNGVESQFLTLANLALDCEDLTFQRELQPISGLDIIGDGLSFIVKRGSVIAPADPPSVAWKISKARLLPSAKMYDDSRTEGHRLRAVLAECRVLCHPPIRNHPNIVTLQQVAWAPDSRDMMSITACLGMEYAEYGTLADLQSYGSIHPLEYSTKKRLCLDVAEGLRALHKCGIVHGDVKSENVLIFKHAQHKYQAKLSDFGCSIITGDYANLTADIEVRLTGFTRGYQAPESARPMPTSQLHLTDTYSLGMLMWRIFVDGQDPLSTFFDLPAESIERQKKISEIQGIGVSIAGVVVATIEQAVDSLEGEGDILLQIFIHTLATIPTQRNLEEVISILQSSLNAED